MKPLKDCEYTAFISYAHADDAAWFNWITQFRNELERSLGAMLRGVRLPRFHLSGENGPVAGDLSDELLRRVDASFAMIIVVHDNYAQSEWCLKELEYFKTLFGDEGFRERLYIVAMSEAAMLQVSGSEAWKRLLPGPDQVWLGFFDHADKARPVDIYMGPGLVAPAFRVPFERLRSDLAAKLKQSAAAAAPAPKPAPVAAAPAAAPAPGGTVLLGFVPPASAAAAAGAGQALAAQGISARLLAQDVVFTDFADLALADHLVLPFDDQPPMLTALAPGGHLELQRDAWLKKGKPPDRLHWLDLREAPPPPAEWQGSAAFVARLGVAHVSLSALAAQLHPQAAAVSSPAAGVRIYIESNRHERTLWEPLASRSAASGTSSAAAWRRSACRRSLCVHAACRSTRSTASRRWTTPTAWCCCGAARPARRWWRRSTRSRTRCRAGRDAAPGFVAYLMPPQQFRRPRAGLGLAGVAVPCLPSRTNRWTWCTKSRANSIPFCATCWRAACKRLFEGRMKPLAPFQHRAAACRRARPL